MYEKAVKLAELVAEHYSRENRRIKLIRVSPDFYCWLMANCDRGTIMCSLEKTSPLIFRGVPLNIDNTILVGQFEIDFE